MEEEAKIEIIKSEDRIEIRVIDEYGYISTSEIAKIIRDRVYYCIREPYEQMCYATDVDIHEFKNEIKKLDEEDVEEIKEFMEYIKRNSHNEEELIEEAISLMDAEEIYISYPDAWTNGDIVVYNGIYNRDKKVNIGFCQDGSLFNDAGTMYYYFYHPDELVVETIKEGGDVDGKTLV